MKSPFISESRKSRPSDSKKVSGNLPEKSAFIKWFYFSIIINILSISGIILLQGFLPPELPLFYGLPEGNDQLTKTLNLILASAASLAIVLINFALSSLIEQDFLKKTLLVAGFCVSVFSLVTTARIILLVGYF